MTNRSALVVVSPSRHTADAVLRGGYFYTSGISAIDDDGQVIAPGNLRAQADHIYGKLAEILKNAGVAWSDVVKVNYYVAPDVDSTADRMVMRDAHKAHIAPHRCAATGAPLAQPIDGCMLQVELIARPGARLESIVVPGVPVASDWAAAVRADDTLYVGGRLPINTPTVLDEPVRASGSLGEQTSTLYAHHDRVLQVAGMGWSDAVQVHQFLTPRKLSIEEFQRARHRYLTPGRYLSTSVACENNFPDFPLANVLIMGDMEADTRDRADVAAVQTWGNKPGPQAFWSGHSILRMHGQVARDLAARTQYENDTAGQARMVFSNLDAVLRTAGVQWTDVVHAHIFCKRRDDVAVVRQVREHYLEPGTCAVTELVADYFDPLLLLEIELVAIRAAH